MKTKTVLKVGGKEIPVSNLDKVYYPETGFTKGEMIDYYIKVAPYLLPHLKGHPLTMKRYPDGVTGPFFYEKNWSRPKPAFVRTARVKRHHEPGVIEYVVVNNLQTLVWAANLGDIELHTLLSKAPKAEQPAAIVFDLDPGPPANAVQCAQVALWLKEIFEKLGLEIFVKSSGSKGMQAYIPLNTPISFEETSSFAKAVARTLEQAHPELVVSDMKKKLREGKVLVDWSQNSETKTTVTVYSLRAKERPYVSMPLEWNEVETCLRQEGCLARFLRGEGRAEAPRKEGRSFCAGADAQAESEEGIERVPFRHDRKICEN